MEIKALSIHPSWGICVKEVSQISKFLDKCGFYNTVPQVGRIISRRDELTLDILFTTLESIQRREFWICIEGKFVLHIPSYQNTTFMDLLSPEVCVLCGLNFDGYMKIEKRNEKLLSIKITTNIRDPEKSHTTFIEKIVEEQIKEED